MRMRLFSVLLALAAAVLLPARGSATPIQLNFAGSWGFYDPYNHTPDFWDAMARAGVVQGSALTYSLLLSDTDTNPDPGVGTYAVYAAQLKVGAVTLTAQPATLEIFNYSAGFGSAIGMSGSWQGAQVGSFSPSHMQLLYPAVSGLDLPSDQLIDALPYLNSFRRNTLFIGFSSPTCHLCMGTTQLTVTSVERVPEPTSLLLLAPGLLLPLLRLRLFANAKTWIRDAITAAE